MTETQVLTLRIPREDYDSLRLVAQAVGKSMNELATSAVRDYLSTKGADAEVLALMREEVERYRVAFDKLADL